jgi:hypothetical protein
MSNAAATATKPAAVTVTFMGFDGKQHTRTFASWTAANRWIPTADVRYVIGWQG